jgi:ribosomal-protein-serine acetyltransferase
MNSINWQIDRFEKVLPEEFFDLIESNLNHIEKTFPVTVSNCLSLEKTTEFIKNNIKKEQEKSDYYFYIRNLETNKLIGYIGIKNIDFTISKCELFYFIDRNFEGKGIISKAIPEIVAFCFNELLMNKIIICTSKINFASQKIALKNGFEQEGILREERRYADVLEDIVYFGLLKSATKSSLK